MALVAMLALANVVGAGLLFQAGWWPAWGAIVSTLLTIGLGVAIGRSLQQADGERASAAAASARQAEVFDKIAGGIVLWDAQQRLVFCNADFRALYGPIADELVPGRSFEALIRSAVVHGLVPEAEGREEAWISERLTVAAAAPGGPIVRRMRDGRWRRIVEQRLADGSRIGFSVDITEQVEQQHQLEQARRESDLASQRLHDAIEALPAGFELWDSDDRLVMTNSVMREIYPQLAHLDGARPTFEQTVRANHAAGGLSGIDGNFEDWLAQRLVARRSGTGRIALRQTADGRTIRTHESRTANGSTVAVRIDVSEVYEQKALADAARDAAERATTRLVDAIEALPDGFAVFDGEDRLILCNQRYREIYRDSAPALVLGTRFEAILRYGLARGQYPQAVGREKEWIAERLYRHRHQGPPILQELAGNHWLRIDERLTRDGGVAGVRTDVTELVRREQELQRLNSQLDKANVQLEVLSDTDSLTGVGNRRKFDRRLAEEWLRLVRMGHPLAMVLIDVDHFKRFNDRHGHQAGDDALRRVAALLRGSAPRAMDLVARYGGEEFVLLLPATDADGAMLVAQRCLAAVDAAAIEHADSTVAAHLTISIGVAVAQPGPGAGNAQQLIRAADAAMYGAKNDGRHRIVRG